MTIRPQSLNFISGNANKVAEVRAILGDVVELSSRSLELVEIQGSIEEIAVDKARRAAEAVSGFFFWFPVAACFPFEGGDSTGVSETLWWGVI